MILSSEPVILVEDTREQLGYSDLFTVPCRRGALDVGDYSVVGLEELVAVERKTLQDLVGSVTHDRDRFERELKRSRTLHRFFVVLEFRPSDLLVESFGGMSKASPASVWGTVMAWSIRYSPFLFAGSRAHGARITQGILAAYAKGIIKNYVVFGKAQGRSGDGEEGKKAKGKNKDTASTPT